MSEGRNLVSIRIDSILHGLSSSPSMPSIRKIDDIMTKRRIENLNEPKLVSIGPLYRGKPHLQKMEQHKLRYLKFLMERQSESTVDKYVVAIRSLEEQARSCYADPVDLCSHEFVEMMLLDGCFTVEFIRKCRSDSPRKRDDPIFRYDHYFCGLVRDLMLVENQIPFCVLDQLFSMTIENQVPLFRPAQSSFNVTVENLQDKFISLIRDIYPWLPGGDGLVKAPGRNVEHLMDLMYAIWYSSSFSDMRGAHWKSNINSATELQEAGILFDKDTTSNLLDITFVKGVLTIPPFTVEDSTEEVLRNLIMYEHFSHDNNGPKYVTDYIFFLDCLINSSNDIKILRLAGILSNLLGDDDMVHQMFKRVGRNAFVSPSCFCYASVFESVIKHCERRWNRWMAILRHNYFNSPWAYISFLAGFVLLLLTLIQTVFSVLSYAKHK